MKYKIFIFILLFFKVFLWAEEQEIYQKLGYIIYDESDNCLLQLGAPCHFLLRKYGLDNTRTILAEFTKPKYAILLSKNKELEVTYSTFYNRIIGLEIYSNKFKTLFGIKVGSDVKMVIKKYGNPYYISGEPSSPVFLLYKTKIPSIHHEAESIYFLFNIKDNKVVSYSFYIDAEV